jgi:hypothetical protein
MQADRFICLSRTIRCSKRMHFRHGRQVWEMDMRDGRGGLGLYRLLFAREYIQWCTMGYRELNTRQYKPNDENVGVK